MGSVKDSDPERLEEKRTIQRCYPKPMRKRSATLDFMFCAVVIGFFNKGILRTVEVEIERAISASEVKLPKLYTAIYEQR